VVTQHSRGFPTKVRKLLHIGGAFLIQSGIGLVVERWPADAAGRYPAAAYTEAFGLNLAPQAAALAWFLLWPALGAVRRASASAKDALAARVQEAARRGRGVSISMPGSRPVAAS
jgi:hypothetical protein